MKRKLLLLVLVFISGLVLWLVLRDNNAIDLSHQNERTDVIEQVQNVPRPSTVKKPLPALTVQNDTVSVLNEPAEKDVPEALSEKMEAIAGAYETSLRYPDYSQPITGKDSPYLQNNTFSIVDVPVLDGQSHAALVLKKYRFFAPEAVEVIVQSPLSVNGVSLSIIDVENGQVIYSESTSGSDSIIKPEGDWPSELRVKAEVSFEGGNDILTADFQYLTSVGKVTGVESPEVAGTDYLIPVAVDVYEKGIYRLRGNLYRKGGAPFAALNVKERLDEGSRIMNLKVHQSVLPGNEKDFELKDIQMERMSGYPGDKGGFGISKSKSFDVDGIDSSQLIQDPYIPSEKETQKLEFLKSMANDSE